MRSQNVHEITFVHKENDDNRFAQSKRESEFTIKDKNNNKNCPLDSHSKTDDSIDLQTHTTVQ